MTVVRPATEADRDRTLAVIVDAFATDPVVRWVFDDDERYPVIASKFFGYLYDLRLAAEGVWVTDHGEGAALWSPPATELPEGVDRAWAEVAAELTAAETDRSDRWDAAVDALKPDGPYWYLGVLAVAPEHQGRGIGPTAAQPGIAAATRAGLPAFLETGVESNAALYQRMGFEIAGVIDDPDLPAGWCMVRPPG
jgi:ribosomal protein S18 acetylase RimI-like enzyme